MDYLYNILLTFVLNRNLKLKLRQRAGYYY